MFDHGHMFVSSCVVDCVRVPSTHYLTQALDILNRCKYGDEFRFTVGKRYF